MINLLLALDALGRFVLATVAAPLLLWTATAAGALGMLRLMPARPLVQYWGRVGLLLALPLGLAAAVFDLLPAIGVSALAGNVPGLRPLLRPLVVDASASGPAWQGGFVGLGVATCVAGALALKASARLLADAVAVARFRRMHSPSAPASVTHRVQKQAAALGIHRPVRVSCTDAIAVPMTVGSWRPHVFLPAALLNDDEAFTLAVTHELVHVRRFDYAVHALVRIVQALCAAHPLVQRCARAAASFREQACDTAVLTTCPLSRATYASMLLQWTQRTPASPAAALGLAYSSSTLKSRIAHMMSFSHASQFSSYASAALSTALLVATFALMGCDGLGLDDASDAPDTATDTAANAAGPSTATSVSTQPELTGGIQSLYRAISYPDIAREQEVGGRVVVQFVVDTEGMPTDLTVVMTDVQGDGSGASTEATQALEDAALSAVRQATFEPGMAADGTPVATQMALPIQFQLSQ